MKIIMATDVYKPVINGVSHSIDTISAELRKRGHAVTIMSPQYPKYASEKDNVCLRSFRFPFEPQQRVTMPLPRKIISKLKNEEWDIIHLHTPFFIGLIGLRLGKYKKAIKVFTYHTIFEEYTHYLPLPKIISKWIALKLSRFFCKACDIVIAPSKDTQTLLVRYGIKKPIVVLPTPIGGFNMDLANSPYLKILNRDSNLKICLYVGRLAKEKNLEFLIKSFKLINTCDENTCLVLIGDGPYRKTLENLVKTLALTKKVFFIGLISRQNLSAWYTHADLFLFSSRTETQGLSLSEALYFGLPAVIVNGPGTRELVKNNINGYITTCNEHEFSRKTLDLLHDDTLRKEFSVAAKQSVANLHTMNVINTLLEIYTFKLTN